MPFKLASVWREFSFRGKGLFLQPLAAPFAQDTPWGKIQELGKATLGSIKHGPNEKRSPEPKSAKGPSKSCPKLKT